MLSASWKTYTLMAMASAISASSGSSTASTPGVSIVDSAGHTPQHSRASSSAPIAPSAQPSAMRVSAPR